MTLTFYDGLGDTANCNCLPPSFLPSFLLSFLPLTPTPPLGPSRPLISDIKSRSIILDAPPCRLPLR